MAHLRHTLADLVARTDASARAADRLSYLPDVHPNPGGLRTRTFVPADLATGAPLVVLLHGCTQDAAGYDRGTGWSVLAERAGFALLLPEQARANNPNGCFNWFQPGDVSRVGGEAESIAAMVAAMVERHRLDPARVFVTGLSAGGAMTAAMLATHPELFAAGAIIGGLPHACASGVPEALQRMRGQGHPGDAELADRARRASPAHRGSWPAVSIWHGSADATVVPANAERLAAQWRALHGLEGTAPETAMDAGVTRRSWRDASGRAVVEERLVAGMGHGVPLDPHGPDALGAAGPFMLDVGVSSTAEIARFFGLVAPGEAIAHSPAVARTSRAARRDAVPADAPAAGVQATIERALRSAGLMR